MRDANDVCVCSPFLPVSVRGHSPAFGFMHVGSRRVRCALPHALHTQSCVLCVAFYSLDCWTRNPSLWATSVRPSLEHCPGQSIWMLVWFAVYRPGLARSFLTVWSLRYLTVGYVLQKKLFVEVVYLMPWKRSIISISTRSSTNGFLTIPKTCVQIGFIKVFREGQIFHLPRNQHFLTVRKACCIFVAYVFPISICGRCEVRSTFAPPIYLVPVYDDGVMAVARPGKSGARRFIFLDFLSFILPDVICIHFQAGAIYVRINIFAKDIAKSNVFVNFPDK